MWRFFLVVFALSIPVFIWGVFWPVHGLPFGLPATAVMVVIPGAVATFEASNARELWRRTFDIRRKRSPRWFLVALLTMPLAVAASYAFMALTGMNLPAARQPFAYGQIAGIAGTFFFGAIFEEIGWTAYATEPLQDNAGFCKRDF